MGYGLGKEQRMLLLGMGASRMTLADFEKAAQASYSTGALLAFTVGSIASWKTGAPATERQKKTVSRVINDTGIDWTDFHLTFGSIDANPALSVEFLNVTNPTGEFTTISATTDLLSLFGTVAAGDTFSLSFDLQANSQAGSFDLFGIHEVPSVPSVAEPAGLAMTGLAIVLGLVTARGRRN